MMKFNILLSAALVLLLGACTGDDATGDAGAEANNATSSSTAVADVSIADLKSAIEKGGVTVIDVNGSDSYAEGHIPSAKSFSAIKDDLAKHLPEDKNALVVAYCGGPKCGAYKKATEAAGELGYTNVAHLSAGISGWKAAGEKVETAK